MIYKEKNLKSVIFLGKSFLMPKSWNIEDLENITEVKDGTHDSPKYKESGIPFITSKNLNNNNTIDWKNIKYISIEEHIKFHKRSNVSKGDIIFGMIGTIGTPVIIKEDFDFSIKNVALIKETSNYNTNFIRYQLLSSPFLKRQFETDQKGGVIKFVKLGDIRKFKILNIKKTEQDKIVSVLDNQQSLIDSYKEKLSLLKEQESYYQDELLSGRLRVRLTLDSIDYVTKQGWYVNEDIIEGFEKEFEEWISVDYKEKIEFYKETEFEESYINNKIIIKPKNWFITKLSGVLSGVVGMTPPKKDMSNYNGNMKWINISDMKTDLIDAKKTINPQCKGVSNRIIEKGSLLYSFKLSVGAMGYAKYNNMITNEAIMSFLPSKNKNLPYFHLILNKYLKLNAGINAFGSEIMNQEKIKNADLLITNKVVERNLIVANLIILKNQEKTIQEKIKIEEEKMEYLMDELLSGRIRVK
jgi:restriction endonuclease S subunit